VRKKSKIRKKGVGFGLVFKQLYGPLPIGEAVMLEEQGRGDDLVSFPGLENVVEVPATMPGLEELGGDFSQYQTVEIKGLSYNSILGQ
jgi:hypothetical protein